MPKEKTKAKKEEEATLPVKTNKKEASPKTKEKTKAPKPSTKTPKEKLPKEESKEVVEEEYELDEELEEELEELEEELEEEVEEVKEEPTPTPVEVEYVEERLYVVPFRKLVYTPRQKRAAKAVRLLRDFAAKHMKSEIVIIDQKVNEQIWARGMKKPPRQLRVRVAKDRDGFVYVLPVTF